MGTMYTRQPRGATARHSAASAGVAGSEPTGAGAAEMKRRSGGLKCRLLSKGLRSRMSLHCVLEHSTACPILKRSRDSGVNTCGGCRMTTSTLILIVLIVLLIAALPSWPHSRSWGYYPSGGLGLVVIILLILLLLGYF
jgi:hypothetical protein